MVQRKQELLLVLYKGVWANISLWELIESNQWLCTEAYGDVKELLLGETSDNVSGVIKDNQWNYQWVKPDEIKDVELCRD